MKTKNTIRTLSIFLISGISLMLTQCKDELVNRVPVTSDSMEAVTTFFKANAPQPQKFIFKAENGINFTSANNYHYSFRPGSFVNTKGEEVVGDVDAELTEYASIEDMIYSGVMTTSNDQLLGSGGMFNIRVTQNGEVLGLKKIYQVYIPYQKQDPGMLLFRGEETTNPDGNAAINWTPAGGVNNVSADSFIYTLDVDFLSWCNLDKFYSNNDTGQIRVQLPSVYTGKNTQVFGILKVDGVRSAFTLFANGNTPGRFDSRSYGMPIGWNFTIIAISGKGDELSYAMVNSTMVKDHLEEITSFTKVTDEELKTIIKGL